MRRATLSLKKPVGQDCSHTAIVQALAGARPASLFGLTDAKPAVWDPERIVE
jgi:hypothetical protein